jgi:hypothetical protein
MAGIQVSSRKSLTNGRTCARNHSGHTMTAARAAARQSDRPAELQFLSALDLTLSLSLQAQHRSRTHAQGSSTTNSVLHTYVRTAGAHV